MRISDTGSSILRLSCWLAVASSALAQSPQIVAVVNAATFKSGLPTGGALATVFVSGLNDPKYFHPGLCVASALPLPNQLASIRVSVCNGIAPLLAVSIPPLGSSDYAQVNFQVPLERNVGLLSDLAPACSLTVGIPSDAGASLSPLPDPPPFGGFFSDGHGYAAAQHASDYSPVTPDNPAHAGEAIVAYANDLYVV
jgi:uncharacterized protein (TIGR03437 family)